MNVKHVTGFIARALGSVVYALKMTRLCVINLTLPLMHSLPLWLLEEKLSRSNNMHTWKTLPEGTYCINCNIIKKHTKIFLEANGYNKEDWIPCNYCGATATDVDHVSNRGMGGSKLKDTPDNLQALCRPCHLQKTNNQS